MTRTRYFADVSSRPRRTAAHTIARDQFSHAVTPSGDRLGISGNWRKRKPQIFVDAG